MSKKLLVPLIMTSLSLCAASAQAVGENTLSLGYAQSHVKADGDKLKEKPKGFNVKYRYEFDNHLGVIGSFAYTHQGYDYRFNSRSVGNGDLDYYSFTAGPTYRFNDYISAYGLLGVAHGKAEMELNALGYHEKESQSKSAFAYGVGLQFNPFPNIAIDTSYEHSKLDGVKVGTWTVGLGYRF
ncbi:Ail/Lom family outer membrane beta-barrel protein [Proteus sp. fly-1089]|uniref:Outer membrane beta-barrel protein n=1 Tax=Proteus faecis TaxID=2050967 RepID=A0ABZ3EI13_9GAMM|nr:Ail/Lom family outer membrane beta-barrel protein [Proteus sp. PR00224]MBI6340236.1 outer membrane beta-barrel protein [Proteus sp. PR00224]